MKPETIKIDEVEYVRKDSIPATYEKRKDGPWEIGERYFIRTVTMFLHGQLVDVTPNELVLTQGAWIADTGRFHQFITGKTKPIEVEPFAKDAIVIVGRGALVDATKLPESFTEQK
jgi:hypothetical protein